MLLTNTDEEEENTWAKFLCIQYQGVKSRFLMPDQKTKLSRDEDERHGV